MADAIAKPVKMTIIRNPKKGFIRNVSQEAVKKYGSNCSPSLIFNGIIR